METEIFAQVIPGTKFSLDKTSMIQNSNEKFQQVYQDKDCLQAIIM